MTTYFVTRHLGAKQWARLHGIAVDRWEDHLDMDAVLAGDTIIGVLPVALAAAVCVRGAHFIELVLNMPAALRGQELTHVQLIELGATLKQYHVEEISTSALLLCRSPREGADSAKESGGLQIALGIEKRPNAI